MSAVNPLERHLRNVRQVGAQRPMREDWACYERMKAEFIAAFPGASPEEYTEAMRTIAKAAGV